MALPTAHWQGTWLSIRDLPSPFRGHPFHEEPGHQHSGHHGLGRFRSVAQQTMGVEHRCETLEPDLDLPSAGVPLQDESYGPRCFWQGGHQKGNARETEGRLAPPGPLVPRLLLLLWSQRFGLLVREDHRQQSHGQALAFREHGGVARSGSWSQPAQPLRPRPRHSGVWVGA